MATQPSHGVFDDDAHTYDAVLYLSFGGPEGPDEVMPFLERVTAGRSVALERLEEVAEHYLHFGGVSPINAQNRAVIDALRMVLEERGPDLPVYWGNRNSEPFLADTLRQMRDHGIARAICFVSSAYASYSGCRQYREDLAEASAAVGEGAPVVDKLRVFFNHPGFVGPTIEKVRAALESMEEHARARAHVLFTAHSVPHEMADTSSYVEQLQEVCRLTIEAIGERPWDLAYQSRSGPPAVPWLEPDIVDHLEKLHVAGATDVVVAPIGFVSDHLEVIYDLDVEAAEAATGLGMNMVRAGTVGTHPDYIEMIRSLIAERMAADPQRSCVGALPPSHDICARDCCPAPQRPGIPPHPAVAEV